MTPNTPLLAITNCANPEDAAKLGRWLVQENLAACVNVLPVMRSIYHWQGQLQEDSESTLLIKTNRVNFDRIKAELPKQHSYDLPELIAIDISNGLPHYLNWLSTHLKP